MESENGTEEPICRGGTDTQTYRMDIWTRAGERELGANWEIGIDIHTLPACKTDS